jgi:hypothetical protein
MKKSLFFLLAISLLVSTALDVAAQQPTNTQPPKVLRIFREDVKASRNDAHAELEAGYVRALQKANWPVYGLGMTSMAGPNDAWFLTGYPSFEAMENDDRNIEKNPELVKEFARLDAADAEFRTNQRGILALLREDLSYNAATDLAQVRYFEVITLRARPGHDGEVVEAARIIRAANEKANRGNHYSVYQVMSGLADGTYLVFIPLKSLKDLDDFMKPESRKAMAAAFGEENGKKLDKLFSDGVLSSESSLYAISPKMSYVSKEFAAANPAFWSPKEMVMAKTSAARKPAPKTTAKKQP